MSAFAHNLRHAFRSLVKAPGFSLLTTLILAIGIAGTIVMAALVQGVLLRPLSVQAEDRLIVAWKDLPSSGYAHAPFGDAAIEMVARESRLLESAAGVGTNGVYRGALVEGDVTEYVNDALVTGGFFDVLGVKPLLGRTLTRADDKAGAERVVVIGHRLWQRLYHGAPDVIGRRLFGDPRMTIVGVMPPGIDYPPGADVWRTIATVEGKFKDAARQEVDLIARLRPGVTLDQADAELTALTRRQQESAPVDAPRNVIPVVRPLKEEVVGAVRPAMVALSCAVALVLVIACVNAANLLLMRGESRRGELAVRMALGAGRGRIAAEVLAETAVLTATATAAGLALAAASLQTLISLVPDGLPRVESVRIDSAVVLFAVLVTLVVMMLTALVPALTVGAHLSSHLKSSGRGLAGSRSHRIRRAFVVAEVALAVTVVAAAGLLTRTVLRLHAIDMGLAADRLVFVEVGVPAAEHADRARHLPFLNAMMLRLEAMPFIAGATPINARPFSGTGGWDVPRFTAEGQTAERAAANPALNLESVFPNYFRTFEVPIVRGRPFVDADREGTTEVAILSEEVAARTWPGEDPIGKRFKMGGYSSGDNWLTVVGVAAPTRYRDLTVARPTLYLPAAQFLVTAQSFALRTSAPLAQIAAVVRESARAVNPRVSVLRTIPFAEMVEGPLARPKFNALLIGMFAVVALVLAAIGLYAVMAMYVRQRDRDIAVRKAIGATAGHIRELVVREALWLSIVGAAIGLAGAAGATRLVRGLLYDVSPLDPLSLCGAAVLLVGLSIAASYIPVRRALRVDPIIALRYD